MMRNLAKSLGLALILVLMGVTNSHAQTSISVAIGSPQNQIDISYFYQNLAPDGEWFQDPTRGWCWTPYDLSADWRPYYDGNWEYTDYGWSWASNEPWGWATYHYGRWFFDNEYGWAWVPGTEWAPAWVAWRTDGDYVGWAPLPPGTDWDDARGLSYGSSNVIPSDEWCFVPQANLLDVNINLQVAPVARNVTFYQRSRDATRYQVRDGHPINIGFDINLFERQTGHAVTRAQVHDADAPDRGNGQVAGSGTVGYFRPHVQRSPVTPSPGPGMTGRGNAIAEADLQRLRAQQQAKLDRDLNAEHTRLLNAQAQELRGQQAGPAAEAVRRQHAVEQQAFTAHAAQQRQVFTQRIQKRVVRPTGPPAVNAPAPSPAPPANPGNRGNGQDKGKGQDKGNDNGQDKGNGPGKPGGN